MDLRGVYEGEVMWHHNNNTERASTPAAALSPCLQPSSRQPSLAHILYINKLIIEEVISPKLHNLLVGGTILIEVCLTPTTWFLRMPSSASWRV